MENVIAYTNLAFPLLGAAAVLYVYYIILIKRQQKLLILMKKSGYTQGDVLKLTDESEQIWWILTMAIVFIGYFGIILYYVKVSHSPRSLIKDAISLGLLFWPILAYIGWRITRSNKGLFATEKT